MKAIILSLLAGFGLSLWALMSTLFSNEEHVQVAFAPGPSHKMPAGRGDLQPPLPLEQERLPEPVAEPLASLGVSQAVVDEREPGEAASSEAFFLRDLSPSMRAGLAKAEEMQARREYGLEPAEIVRRKTTALALGHGLKLDPESWQYNRLWMYVEHCKEWGYTQDEALHAALPGLCPDPCPSLEWGG